MTDPSVLTAEQIAEHLSVSIHTVRRHFRTGSLPGRKVGKSWTTTRAALDAWLVGGNARELDNGESRLPALETKG